MDTYAAELNCEARSRISAREGWLLPATDLVVFAACFFLSRTVNLFVHGFDLYTGYFGWRVETGDQRIIAYTGLTLVCILTFYRLGHYARRRPFWQELGDIFSLVVIIALIDGALVYWTKGNMSRLWMVTNWSMVAVMVPLTRYVLKRTMLHVGAWRRPTVILGTGPNAIDSASALASEPLLGFDLIAFLGVGRDEPGYVDVDEHRYPVLPIYAYPNLLPPQLGQPHVVVALEMAEMERHKHLVDRLARTYRSVDVVSPMRGLPLAATHLTHFFSHDVLALRLHNNLAQPLPRLIKRAFDLVVASLMMVLTAPLFALIAWQVHRTGSKVFFGHRRIGRNGKPFVCYKFRTMVPDAERRLQDLLARDALAREEWELHHKLRLDPRVTPIGDWLRRTSLDELPQLWNVLKGEMSLVGPRPVIGIELPRYGDDLPYYFECTPGLTGLWQISGRNDIDYRRRVHLDSWYAKNWTLWYDIVILLRTWPVLFRRKGAY